MDKFWGHLTNVLRFTGVHDKTIWQDVLVSAILIPFFFFTIQRTIIYFDRNRPIKSLLKGFLKSGSHILIFHSQLKAVDSSGRYLPNPLYVNEYPTPTPTNRSQIGIVGKQNIDPVWAEGDGECLSSTFNLLGRAGKVSGIEIAHTVKDWSKHSHPIISIGFNPKTTDLIKRCEPIDFTLNLNTASLDMPKTGASVDAYRPNDGGVIQKTFIKSTGVPVIILAGLGTVGTSSAGFVMTKEARKLGKLYGDKPFCLLLKADSEIGTTSGELSSIYPTPSRARRVLYFMTYRDYKKRGLLPPNLEALI